MFLVLLLGLSVQRFVRFMSTMSILVIWVPSWIWRALLFGQGTIVASPYIKQRTSLIQLVQACTSTIQKSKLSTADIFEPSIQIHQLYDSFHSKRRGYFHWKTTVHHQVFQELGETSQWRQRWRWFCSIYLMTCHFVKTLWNLIIINSWFRHVLVYLIHCNPNSHFIGFFCYGGGIF